MNLLKNLSHPNIVVSAILLYIEYYKVVDRVLLTVLFFFPQRYLGTAREAGSLNILLEFVPGGSISSLLGKFGSFPESVSAVSFRKTLSTGNLSVATSTSSCLSQWT